MNAYLQNNERHIGFIWSSVRGYLERWSTKDIKVLLGEAGFPVYRIEYSGTYKGPLLNDVDIIVRNMNDQDRDRLVIACIEVLIKSFITSQNEDSRKKQSAEIKELETILSRVGYGIKGQTVYPLLLQVDLELSNLSLDIRVCIEVALRRYRDGDISGAITSICGAVDKLTEDYYTKNSLGDHKESSYQERVSKSFYTLGESYCKPLKDGLMTDDEIRIVWENHKKSVSQAAYVLGSFRRHYSDVHGENKSSPEFVQRALDCSVFILRSFKV